MKANKGKRSVYLNYRIGEIIKTRIKKEKNIEQRLSLISYLSNYYIHNFSGKYSDEFLESELIKVGEQINIRYNYDEVKKNTILHVMTKAYSIGGHTAVVNNWIKFDKSKVHSVLLTDSERQEVPKFLINTIKESGGKLLFLKNNVSKIDKAKQLLSLSQGYEKIVLSTHMDDIIPIISYSNKQWKTPIYFYNHANFLFSLGISISDLVLCICEYDKEKAIKYRGASKTEVLPVPYTVIGNYEVILSKQEAKRYISENYNIPIDSKIIISMGSNYKYNKIEGYDFAKFVEKLLSELSGNTYFIIIGADKGSKRWIELNKKTNGHMIALGYLEREEVTKLMKGADLYIDSFPMASGGCLEALHENIPTITLKITERVKEAYGKFSYKSTDKMVEAAKKVLDENQTLLTETELKKVLYYFSKENWLRMLSNIYRYQLEHKINEFNNKKIFSKEEVINFQLFDKNVIYSLDNSKFNTVNKMYLFIINFILKAIKYLLNLN